MNTLNIFLWVIWMIAMALLIWSHMTKERKVKKTKCFKPKILKDGV